MITFFVPGVPVGKQRARSSTRIAKGAGGKPKAITRHYTPAETVNYEALVSWTAKKAIGSLPLITGPVDIELRIFLPVPASWSKRRRALALAGLVLPTVKPDVDNIEKAINDALNKVVWKDDAQVCDVVKRKRYSEQPGVMVKIKPIENAEAA
ncbi:RusA family crossover junction endodeoxyribonuclease [Chromobacterium vaccinii]|uniref:RusA family crossover junction endodeoxyribonuclease n=1 Tax=Chromobacterium vaccinii TaxID=1108595 RepID=UPI003C717F61